MNILMPAGKPLPSPASKRLFSAMPPAFGRSVLFFLILPLLLGACASKEGTSARGTASVALATDGPPLSIVGEYAGMRLEGYMDRNCMAGYGSIGLRAVGQYRKGDLAVDVPDLPEPPEEEPAAKEKAGAAKAPEPAPPLALASYPRQRLQDDAQPAQTPREQPKPESKKKRGLSLASYPQDIAVQSPVPAPKEDEGKELLPNSPRLRSQSGSADEYEASVPVGIEFICEAKVDAPPTQKGRIRGLLHCSGNRQILFSLRNIGPDQGVGVGKETENSGIMVLFYHSSMDEARRRFPAVREDIRLAQQRQE